MGELKDDGQSSDLRRVVGVNEEVKTVIRISSEVNLVAINAMLIAKRSGDKSSGFAVVSSELRVFSKRLDDLMAGLAELIFGLVRDSAAMQKQSREWLHLRNTRARGDRAGELAEPIMLRKEGELRKIGESIKVDWRDLQLQIDRALQLCESGRVLSRSAKIESVYGGNMSATLRQVANQIETAVDHIITTLKQLRIELAE